MFDCFIGIPLPFLCVGVGVGGEVAVCVRFRVKVQEVESKRRSRVREILKVERESEREGLSPGTCGERHMEAVERV